MSELLAWLERLPRRRIIAGTLVMIVVLGLLNVLIGPELSFSVFYLLPVSVATWHVGLRFGVAVAVISALTWRAAETYAGAVFSHPLIPFWNMLVRLGFFLVTAWLLARLRLAFVAEQRLARTDVLTDADNRRQFYVRAELEIQRSGRYRHPFTTAYLDLDNFKQVNDRYGHQTGDQLLRVVVDTLRQHLRATDCVARLGGDEFALLLPETGTDAARDLITRVNDHLLAVMREHGWPVTFSVGVVSFLAPPASVDSMVERMDKLMYGVKKTSKNAIDYQVDG